MASFISLILLLSSCSLFFFLVVARKEFAQETSENEAHHYHNLQVASLLPTSICNPSTEGSKIKGSLEVVHGHGPCSKLSDDMSKLKPLTLEEILTYDQSRVDSMRARARVTINRGIQGSKATLPTKSAQALGSNQFIVTIGLGTPRRNLSLIIDTGSSLTWTQCQPCARSCYNQQEPIFEPSRSTTYTNTSCTSTECSDLTSANGITPGCSSSTCVYGVQYDDDSFSVGFYGKEKLTLTPKDVIDNFYFGCGQNNQGLWIGVAGLLGLGPNKVSIVSQTSKKYRKVFSYCLPSTSSSTGHLTFGSSGNGGNVKYTPLLISQGDFYYRLNLASISVGGIKLPISQNVFKTSGFMIDSGTIITRLPPTAYSVLRKAFRAGMRKYPLTRPLSILDTCYDLSKFTSIDVPKIIMLWGGNTNVNIVPQGILIASDVSQVCLAFAPNDDDSDIGIFGNVQQKTLGVVYDVGAGKVGFTPGGCA